MLGIEVHVHWSLALIFALVLVNLGVGVFPSMHPGWGPVVTWLTAAGAAVLFFASILAHELSHSVVARAQGIGVERITLFLFGGVSEMKDEPPTPKSEFLMAVVGPLTSLAIGVLAIAGGTLGLAASPLDLLDAPGEALPDLNPVETLLLWLGPLNILLGLFNLVPGFPLDGGRVFRSALWWITGDVLKATRWAAVAGQVFGWILIFFGVTNLFGGASVQGLWLILIGWFLSNAAGMSYQQMFLRQTLRHVPVTDLMRKVPTLEPDLSIQAFVDDYLMGGEHRVFPVALGPEFLGLVRLRDVQKIPREKWPWTGITGIMTPREQLKTLDCGMTAARAARVLTEDPETELPVLDGRSVVGILGQQDLVRWITLHPAPARETP